MTIEYGLAIYICVLIATGGEVTRRGCGCGTRAVVAKTPRVLFTHIDLVRLRTQRDDSKGNHHSL